MNRFVTTFALTAASLVFASPAFAAKLKVPGQFPTIQSAINAAGPGDVIRISKGTYTESIVIAGISDLRLEGKGKVVLDGEGGAATVLVLAGQNVHLKGLTMRNADIGVASLGMTGLRIEDCVIKEMADYGVFVDLGTGCIVESCRIQQLAGDGVVLEDSTGCSVIDSKFVNVDGNGIEVSGLQHSIVGNRFEKVAYSAIRAGLASATAGLLVADNRFRLADNGAVHADDSVGMSVLGNDFRGGVGMAVYTTATTSAMLVDDNRFKKIGGPAILFRSQDSTVSRNRSKKCEVGVVVQGPVTGSLFQENKLRKSSEHGIYNQATGNVFLGNVAAKNAVYDLNDLEDPTSNTWIGNSIGTTN